MLALAGYPLGLQFRFLDQSPDAPAGQVAELVVGRFDDREALAKFIDGLDVVTLEFENVPLATAEWIAERVALYPPPAALRHAQDRLLEKQLFNELEIPTAAYVAIESLEELEDALEQIGAPALLKTRRWGYDGKGQVRITSEEDLPRAWESIAGQPSILEGLVRFDREVSILAARSTAGEVICYPLVENVHEHGILTETLAPAPGTKLELQELAEEAITDVLDELEYVGLLAIEFFEVEGRLYANEFAPRDHNSGHWTLDGAVSSQFQNHLRAICGLPLGRTDPYGRTVMLNLIGELPDRADLLRINGVSLHLYGKQPRPGRKLGHVNVRAVDESKLAERVGQVRAVLRTRHAHE
jgi:5-(carboxyamino)imidazole ribonucleotide synthase